MDTLVVSNTLKRPKRPNKRYWHRRIKHKQRLLTFLVSKVDRNRRHKNKPIDDVIKEGSWSDKDTQKPQNNKSKIGKREQIRRLRRQKERKRWQNDI